MYFILSPVNQVETTSHQMSSAFLKKSGKGWSQVQYKHREGKMLRASISHQTARDHFLKGERYHSSTVSPCEPNSYHGIKVMQLCLGSALMYTAQYSPGMGVTSSALKHMHIYVREKNLI